MNIEVTEGYMANFSDDKGTWVILLGMLAGIALVLAIVFGGYQNALEAQARSPLRLKAVQLGIDLPQVCKEGAFGGASCYYVDAPLTASQLSAALLTMGECQADQLRQLTNAGTVIGVAALVQAEGVCVTQANDKVAKQRRAESLAAQRAVLERR